MTIRESGVGTVKGNRPRPRGQAGFQRAVSRSCGPSGPGRPPSAGLRGPVEEGASGVSSAPPPGAGSDARVHGTRATRRVLGSRADCVAGSEQRVPGGTGGGHPLGVPGAGPRLPRTRVTAGNSQLRAVHALLPAPLPAPPRPPSVGPSTSVRSGRLGAPRAQARLPPPRPRVAPRPTRWPWPLRRSPPGRPQDPARCPRPRNLRRQRPLRPRGGGVKSPSVE